MSLPKSGRRKTFNALMHALAVVARSCAVLEVACRTRDRVNRSVMSMESRMESRKCRRGWLEMFIVAYLLASISRERLGKTRVVKWIEYWIIEQSWV